VTTETLIKALARIEELVRASDGEAILARWDFGQAVLGQRQGKQLPKGLLEKIIKGVGISQRELSNRTSVAEHYDREKLSSQLLSSAVTWTALVNGLPKKRATPKQPAKPAPTLRPEPTRATMTEADRVETLIVKPDVAAELARRAVDDEAARKAQALVERRERAEAKAQKERDQETAQRQQVLRARLIRGDSDWQNLTDQMETMADTVRRLIALLDGLPTPDDLHRKMFERHLAAAQQALFELRQHLTPDYHGERPAVPSRANSPIEVVAR
jgi:hypothetical protein